MKVDIADSVIELLPSRAVFLRETGILVVADLHFGKVQHFRRGGLPVPLSASQRNAEVLIDLINLTKPGQTVFLGDLFHSHYNEDWEVVGQIVGHFPTCRFKLILGNHDIMTQHQYERKGIEISNQETIGRFLLTHEPLEQPDIPDKLINLAGHIHPGARLEGKGRQAITLPCFWLKKNQMVLPAFGSFTGLYSIRPKASDKVFVILENKVLDVSASSTAKKSMTE